MGHAHGLHPRDVALSRVRAARAWSRLSGLIVEMASTSLPRAPEPAGCLAPPRRRYRTSHDIRSARHFQPCQLRPERHRYLPGSRGLRQSAYWLVALGIPFLLAGALKAAYD